MGETLEEPEGQAMTLPPSCEVWNQAREAQKRGDGAEYERLAALHHRMVVEECRQTQPCPMTKTADGETT